jgi:hypothetical protein
MVKPETGGEENGCKHPPGLPGCLGTARRERFVEEPGKPGGVEATGQPTFCGNT